MLWEGRLSWTLALVREKRGSLHLEVRHAVSTSALLFPFPGPVHSACGGGTSSRVRDEPATGPFWLDEKVGCV
jgi:hypothetical protein